MAKFLRKNIRDPKYLVASIIIALCLTTAIFIFPIQGLLLLFQPEHAYFSIQADPSGNAYLPRGRLPNVTISVDVITPNPAGLSVGNSVNMTVVAQLPFDLSKFGNATEVAFTPFDASFVFGGIPISQCNTCAEIVMHRLAGSENIWVGSAKVAYFASGTLPGILTFIDKNGNGNGSFVAPFIQVSPALNTLQFVDDIVLVALELVVIALIALEIALTHWGKKYRYEYQGGND